MDVYIYMAYSVMERKIHLDKINNNNFYSFGRIEIHIVKGFKRKIPISGILPRCKLIFPFWRLQSLFFLVLFVLLLYKCSPVYPAGFAYISSLPFLSVVIEKTNNVRLWSLESEFFIQRYY